MAYKRPRSTFEADLQTKESPFVTYGTPFPPFDSDARDDGSYVPIWKQEVTDERGRKRLHGAFTGGFSAGYFNTVGSKDGWTPSSFVSSRTNRRKDVQKNSQIRAEDIMDDEDLAEVAESQALQTSQAFTGFGSTAEDAKRKGMLMELFRAEGDTMGVKLLRKMGWRDGQGIGPRVRRKAQLDDDEAVANHDLEDHLFAPTDTRMITFRKKDDHKGLGFEGEDRLGHEPDAPSEHRGIDRDNYESQKSFGPNGLKTAVPATSKKSGFGTGVLNDTGSDDEDPFEIGPRISYTKVVGGDKKKQKSKVQKSKTIVPNANPLVANKPIFIPRNSTAPAFRKCHDGRLPIDGFLLSDPIDAFSAGGAEARYPRPKIPKDWQSAKKPSNAHSENPTYQSTADAAKLSKMDVKSRAEILGETQLPGKSVFDFLSSSARERIASATGRTNLPQALNETIPQASKASSTPSVASHISNEVVMPSLPKETALAALGRGTAGWTPYASEPQKSQRYRSLLEFLAGLCALPPSRPTDLKPEAWQQELREFAHAAEVFKPMTGLMASRFTSSSSAPKSSAGDEETVILENPPTGGHGKPDDPAEEAARLGMFGPMTRSVRSFFPTRLVCKRFGVKPPEHVTDQPNSDDNVSAMAGRADGWRHGAAGTGNIPDLVSRADLDKMRQESMAFRSDSKVPGESPADPTTTQEAGNTPRKHADASMAAAGAIAPKDKVDAERNEALEGKRAGEELFKAIFGDDDSD